MHLYELYSLLLYVMCSFTIITRDIIIVDITIILINLLVILNMLTTMRRLEMLLIVKLEFLWTSIHRCMTMYLASCVDKNSLSHLRGADFNTVCMVHLISF